MRHLFLHHKNTPCLLHLHTHMQSQQCKEHWVHLHVITSNLTLTSIITREQIKKSSKNISSETFPLLPDICSDGNFG